MTSARHDALDKTYGVRYPESYDTNLDESVVYIGPHKFSDELRASSSEQKSNIPPQISIGKLLLSPTRTYAPLMKVLLREHFNSIHGLIHCSGGGQTKCMKYLPANFRIIKDNLFEAPVVFDILQKASGSDNREMYQVFNMGHRLEVFTDSKSADALINAGKQLGIEAKIVGRVEAADKKELLLKVRDEVILY